MSKYDKKFFLMGDPKFSFELIRLNLILTELMSQAIARFYLNT